MAFGEGKSKYNFFYPDLSTGIWKPVFVHNFEAGPNSLGMFPTAQNTTGRQKRNGVFAVQGQGPVSRSTSHPGMQSDVPPPALRCPKELARESVSPGHQYTPQPIGVFKRARLEAFSAPQSCVITLFHHLSSPRRLRRAMTPALPTVIGPRSWHDRPPSLAARAWQWFVRASRPRRPCAR